MLLLEPQYSLILSLFSNFWFKLTNCKPVLPYLLAKRVDLIEHACQWYMAIPPRSSRLWICCKMQIISSFHLCSDLVTAFIRYFPTSKLLILSSATLELALICLTAVINCTNSHLSRDVSFATAIDMFCFVGHICYLI